MGHYKFSPENSLPDFGNVGSRFAIFLSKTPWLNATTPERYIQDHYALQMRQIDFLSIKLKLQYTKKAHNKI
jgi:hypothetical protein